MRTRDFDYHLPPRLIAAHPAQRRDGSRLLVLDRESGALRHEMFPALGGLLRPGDCLVLNETRVFPARLRARRRGGGQAEFLLLHPEGEEGCWRAMARPARKLLPGTEVRAGDLSDGEGIAIRIEAAHEEGERTIRIETTRPVGEFLEQYGEVPLPPYIVSARKPPRRPPVEGADPLPPDEEEEARGALVGPEDVERYQTVYARNTGSVAAPTAGLHFTSGMLEEIARAGVEIRRITLHVGPGTFVPVKATDPHAHPMHRERFVIEEGEAEAIQAAVLDPARRVVAVGTTVVRALEACMAEKGRVFGGENETGILILPGHDFRAVDALVTNFHLPRSTLLMLVAAFAGTRPALAAYREAVEREYRFYSYGDAMFIG